MRVILATGIYAPEVGGPPIFVREFARSLYGTKTAIPVVVTYGDAQTTQGEGWVVVPVSRAGGPIVRYLRYAWNIFLQARQADVVFVQGAVSEGLPGTIGALLAGKKTVMRVPGDYAWEMAQQLSGQAQEFLDDFVTHRHTGRVRLLEMIERWTAGRASRVIVPSKYMKGIVAKWGVDPARLRVIYSNPEPFPQKSHRETARAELKCEGHTVLFVMARLVPWKGLDFLVDVLRELPVSHILVIAGDGPLRQDLQDQAERLHIADRVRLLGRVDRGMMEKWYTASDAFICASSYEGFPHGVVEAAMKGLPTFVSDRGGNIETKELFPKHVTILPYRDKTAWTVALGSSHARVSEFPPRPFSEVTQEILQILKEAL